MPVEWPYHYYHWLHMGCLSATISVVFIKTNFCPVLDFSQLYDYASCVARAKCFLQNFPAKKTSTVLEVRVAFYCSHSKKRHVLGRPQLVRWQWTTNHRLRPLSLSFTGTGWMLVLLCSSWKWPFFPSSIRCYRHHVNIWSWSSWNRKCFFVSK